VSGERFAIDVFLFYRKRYYRFAAHPAADPSSAVDFYAIDRHFVFVDRCRFQRLPVVVVVSQTIFKRLFCFFVNRKRKILKVYVYKRAIKIYNQARTLI